MDYERENAKEWQMSTNSGPNAGASDIDASDDGHDPYAGNDWQQVTRKKQPKVSANPAAKPPANPVDRYPAKSPAKPLIRYPPSSKPPPPSYKAPPKRYTVPPSSQPRAVAQNQSTPKPRMILFSNKNDNPARAAFRAQQPHTNEFILTKNCYAIEPERERLYDILEEMGVRIGSFIRPPQSATDRRLLLWGTEEQTSETIRELHGWVSQSNAVSHHVTKHGVAFAKTGQLSQGKADKLDKEMRRLAMKIKYQKAPDPNLSFPHIGYFLWPVDEIRPDDLLGPSYEAFDPIRMDYHSYILFNDQLSAFQILSLEKGAVENAMKRIQGTMKEFVARNSREIAVHMVERPQARLTREDVRMKRAEDERAVIPSLAGKYLTPLKLAEWDRESEQVEDHQFAHWRQTLDKGLKRLRYYRGHVRMRVLLGTFHLTAFRRLAEGIDSMTFQNFVKDMDLTAVKGHMERDLQAKTEAKVLFSNICNATGIFAPADVMTRRLDSVAPMYTACFDFDIPGTGKVRLEMEMGKPGGGGGMYEATRSQWTRNTEKVDTIHPVEVFMIRLNDGISWELQVSTPTVLDTARITPMMDAFINSVRFNPPPAGTKPGAAPLKCFSWGPNPLRVFSFEQKTSLRYRIRDESRWMFEFSRYDLYHGNFPGPSPMRPTTQWGATFWNSEWDRVFKENSKARIGDPANWDPNVETFFPSRDAAGKADAEGLREFLERTKTIAEVLDGMEDKE